MSQTARPPTRAGLLLIFRLGFGLLLLDGLLLVSGNDAANTLAEGLGGYQAAVARMNAKAAALGLNVMQITGLAFTALVAGAVISQGVKGSNSNTSGTGGS